MKKIFKLAILSLAVLFFAQSAFAICRLKDVGLGKKSAELSQKYRLVDDLFGRDQEQNYHREIRGADICQELSNAEVSLVFVDDTLAEVQIYNISGDKILFNTASNDFGAPDRLPRNNPSDLEGYSNLWDVDKNLVSYSFNFSATNQTYTEILHLQDKDFSRKLEKQAIDKENLTVEANENSN